MPTNPVKNPRCHQTRKVYVLKKSLRLNSCGLKFNLSSLVLDKNFIQFYFSWGKRNGKANI